MKQEDKDLLLQDLCTRLPYGAEWADETMIEKACKWLSLLADGFEITDKIFGIKYDKEQLINDFKNSMKL